MTATSIGPDSNQVLQALSNLKWLCVMDAFPTTSSEFWRAPGIDPAKVQTEVFMLPASHWIEKDGSFTNSGRWVQWKDQVLPPEGDARHDHWILADLFQRVRGLYRQQGDRKSTRLNSSHVEISYAVFCLKKKKKLNKSDLLSQKKIRVLTNT